MYVYSLNLEFGESSVMNKFKYNWHNAKNSYHSQLFTNAVSSDGVLFFLRRVVLVVEVLLSSKSLVCLLGCLFAFFEELLYMLCYLLLASSKVYFVCGVAWLVRL